MPKTFQVTTIPKIFTTRGHEGATGSQSTSEEGQGSPGGATQ